MQLLARSIIGPGGNMLPNHNRSLSIHGECSSSGPGPGNCCSQNLGEHSFHPGEPLVYMGCGQDVRLLRGSTTLTGTIK